MNLDDETYLSAYLDDELDPADRLAAEWSIESSPLLAEQLRALGLARDAVAGLDRPAIPRDLAPALGACLAANRRKARIRALLRPARMATVLSGFMAIAASLIFALILLHHSLHENFDPRKNQAQPVLADANRHHSLDASLPVTSPSSDSTSSQLASRDHGPPTVPSPFGSPKEVREQRDRRRIAGMLEGANARRIVIDTDDLDASDRIKELIHQAARKNPEYGRISLCREIVIDLDRAEDAEVFVVPMDEQGRRLFVQQLARSFPNLVEEDGEPSPDLLTQLSEVGQVALFRGLEASPLLEPPSDLYRFIANRANDSPDHFVSSDRQSWDQNRPLVPPAIEKAGPFFSKHQFLAKEDDGSDFVGPPAPDRLAELHPNEPVLVLVWVTRPSRL